MSTQDCARWVDIADREALGEPLSEEERAFASEHAEACPHCRGEMEAWDRIRSIPSHGGDGGRPPSVEELLGAAPALRPAPKRRRGRRVVVTIAAGSLAAAAAVALVLLWPPRGREPGPPERGPAEETAWVTAGDAVLCLETGTDITVCLAPGSRARPMPPGLVPFGLRPRPRRRGGATPPRAIRGDAFRGRHSFWEVEALGTTFSVEAPLGQDAVTVRLLEGRLRLRASAAEPIALDAGHAMALGAAGPRALEEGEARAVRVLLGLEEPAAGRADASALAVGPPTPRPGPASEVPTRRAGQEPRPERGADAAASITAATLLARSRSLRGEGRYREAVAAYRELQSLHPRSAEARASLVSLGQVQLDNLGDPAAGLASFDRYVEGGGGALEHEARYGRIRALRALGRTAEERRAIDMFLIRFSASPRARDLRRRLRQIGGE